MRILVDARVFTGAGIARYVRALTRRWLMEPEVDEIRFLGDPGRLEGWLAERDPRGIARVVPWTDPPYSLRAQVRWPTTLHRHAREADVSFFPYHDVPLLRHPTPSVVTVHDLTHFLAPEGFPFWKRVAGSVLVDGALGSADRVLTVSQNSRADIVARAPDVASRVSVVPNGVDELFRPLTEEEGSSAEERWAHLRPFLLAVGSARPHKNLELAVELVARLRSGGRDLRLVLVGPGDRRIRSVLDRAEALGVEKAVEVTGLLEDRRLREAYAMATLFVFPSLYEGFGLPPLEAMACGTPVLSSSRGPMPEVLGDAAVLLDPGDVGAWEAAAARLLDGTDGRQEWIEKGFRKAREYSWDRTAAATLGVLRSAARRLPAVSREPS